MQRRRCRLLGVEHVIDILPHCFAVVMTDVATADVGGLTCVGTVTEGIAQRRFLRIHRARGRMLVGGTAGEPDAEAEEKRWKMENGKWKMCRAFCLSIFHF